MLFLAYMIGLWFTLRTHAATIWNTELDEKKFQALKGPNGSISQHAGSPQITRQSNRSGSISRNQTKETQIYRRILGQSLKQVGLNPLGHEEIRRTATNNDAEPSQVPLTPYLVPPKSSGADNNTETTSLLDGLSEEQNAHLGRQVAETAATAATVAARDATRAPRKTLLSAPTGGRRQTSRAPTIRASEDHEDLAGLETMSHAGGASGGHDAPNWSRTKSTVILLGATLLYAIIAEILVSTVDIVLESVDIDEKFLGITLFALVPNTTEFLVSCEKLALIHARDVNMR
jgi:Ca2+:H+ antiporter